jgi:hypothetical protein
LGNLFQKDLELFAIEREIVALFKELEQVNARYLALFGAQGGSSFVSFRPPCLTSKLLDDYEVWSVDWR